MTNHYAFHCPVKGGATRLEHCEGVHSKAMQSKHREIEDKVCALAHLCWMCPARNAFRVGGIWSHYDHKPRSEKEMATPAKLPRDLVAYALSHTTPSQSDYRRCGMYGDEVGMHDELFQSLQSSVAGKAPVQPSRNDGAARKTKARKKTAADVVGKGQESMAEALTEAVRAEKKKLSEASQKRENSAAARDTQERRKAPQRSAQRAPEASTKPRLSLAERAKLMRQRKTA